MDFSENIMGRFRPRLDVTPHLSSASRPYGHNPVTTLSSSHAAQYGESSTRIRSRTRPLMLHRI